MSPNLYELEKKKGLFELIGTWNGIEKEITPKQKT
jgi:hypothetical protein